MPNSAQDSFTPKSLNFLVVAEGLAEVVVVVVEDLVVVVLDLVVVVDDLVVVVVVAVLKEDHIQVSNGCQIERAHVPRQALGVFRR